MSQYDVLPDLNKIERNGKSLEQHIIRLEEDLMILERARDLLGEDYRRLQTELEQGFVAEAAGIGVISLYGKEREIVIEMNGLRTRAKTRERRWLVPQDHENDFVPLRYKWETESQELLDWYASKQGEIALRHHQFKEAILAETEISPLAGEESKPQSVALYIVRGNKVYTATFGAVDRPKFAVAEKLTPQMLTDPNMLERIRGNGHILGTAYRVVNPSGVPTETELANYAIGKLMDKLYDGRLLRMARLRPSELN